MTSSLPAGPTPYGKYHLLERIARGGMAEVYRAKSHGVEGFEKILVIKRILPELAEHPDFVDMFINEAKIAVSLSHANIVQVFDLGHADESYFIAMEYVAGLDLSTLLKRCRKYDLPLPPRLAVYIASEVAKALDYAHRRRDPSGEPLNIVHRDVSPQNMLLSYEGEVKITDFGIAKARTSVQGTEAGVLKGKYSYMSPEQARGEPVDHRTDVFALGTVMYLMLTGTHPFRQEVTYETLLKVRDADFVPIRDAAPDVPEDLAAVVEHCLARDRDARPESAGRVYEDLMQFLFKAGRRVRAGHLADHIEAIMQARGEGLRDSRDTIDGNRIRASFAGDETADEGAARVMDPESVVEELTPVERPRSAMMPAPAERSRPTTDSGLSGVARPQAERRDLTVVVCGPVMFPTPRDVEDRVHWYGGQLLRRSKEDGGFETALFGLDSPDGRETEAAARAMLEIRKRRATAGQGALQVGMHTARVLVDISGALLRDDRFSALVAQATTLAKSAAPGQIFASDPFEKDVRRAFSTRRVPGSKQWLLVDEHQLTAAAGRFVGRRAELRHIGDAILRAGGGGRRVIGISGDAGTGKTRLVLETMLRLRRDHHRVAMHVVRLEPARRSVPLSTVRELVRVVLGIDELDGGPELERKLARLRQLGLGGDAAGTIHQLLGLGGEPAHPAEGDRPLRAALAQVGAAIARDRPLVVAFDGMQNADYASLSILQAILTRPDESPILAILTYRPAPGQPWRQLPQMTEMELGPLDQDETRQLIAARVGTDELPADLVREVGDKSGGNPLYVEEYIRALLESGALQATARGVRFESNVAEVEVPKTLRGIVASRLSTLGPTERHLLQIAAVAGSYVTRELLSRVADEDAETVGEAVGILARRRILYDDPNGLMFAHEMTREVLRKGLPLEALRELHAAVARTLEELYPERRDALSEVLAMHHEAAGETLAAVAYLERAARRMARENAFAGAIDACARALELLSLVLEAGPDRRFELYRLLGELCFAGRELQRGAERMAAAYELAEALQRSADVAHFAKMRGLLLSHANRFAEARVWLDRARQVARALDDPGLLGDVSVATADALTRAGDYGGAVGLLREALTVSREAGDRQAQSQCLSGLAMALAAAGEADGAREAMREAWDLTPHATQGGAAYTRCALHLTEARVHYYLGGPSTAIASAARASELAKSSGLSYEEADASLLMGECHLRLDDVKRAFAQLRHAYELSHNRGFKKLEHHSLRMLGFLDATKFGSQAGRDRVVRACQFAEREGYLTDQIEGRYLLAFIDAQRGDNEEARRGFEHTLQLAQEYGHAHFVTVCESALDSLLRGSKVPLPR